MLVVVGVGVLLANPIADQVTKFRNNVPGPGRRRQRSRSTTSRPGSTSKGIQVQIQEQGQSALQTIGDNLAQGSGELVSFTRDALTLAVEASIALILVLVLSVYMLLYGEQIGDASCGASCRRATARPRTTSRRASRRRCSATSAGQFLFSLIMGASAGVGLWVLGSLGIFPDGKTYALFFGALLRVRGADPVRRAGDRRASRR